jgi:photosystem II stability/assembly factor-like uncharacterized protein
MNRCWWLVAVVCLACQEPSSADSALELGVQHSNLFWHGGDKHPWHRHHRKHGHHCRNDEPDAASCAWSRYDRGLTGAPAYFVYFDDRVRGLVYAVSGGDIWQSTDGGETWSPRGDAGPSIGRLSADGTDPALLMAATGAGVRTSRDAGASWTTLSLSGLNIELLDSPVVQPQRVYGTVDLGPLLISRDGGEHWVMAGLDYPRGDTVGLSVDPRDALNVVTALQQHLPGRVSSNGLGALFRSLDGGKSWQTVFEANNAVHALARCPAHADVLLAATESGVVRSNDNGATWSLTSIATWTIGTIGIAINPRDCDEYYALQADQGPRHTRDGGATFSEPLVDGLQLTKTGSFPGKLAIDPEDASHLILATHGGFYASHDSGEHWTVLPIMIAVDHPFLASSTYRGSEAWLSTWGQGVWTRSGESADWQRIGIDRLPVDYVAGLSLDPGSARVLVLASPPQFSEDGETFTAVANYSTGMSGAFHPSDPAIIYLTTQLDGVLKSEDGGRSWHLINGDLPRVAGSGILAVDARTLVLDPQRPEHLYLTTFGQGIYRSQDAGATWAHVHEATERATCLVLVSQPSAAAPKLFACLSGITASEDGGATWAQLNDGLPSLDISALVHDPATGRLYASTGDGVFVLPAGGSTWRALDPDCESGARGMTIVEEAGRRYLVIGAELSVRRIAL